MNQPTCLVTSGILVVLAWYCERRGYKAPLLHWALGYFAGVLAVGAFI